MKRLLQAVSAAGLLLTVGPSILVFAGLMRWESHALLMAVGTVLWFVTAPGWMHEKPRHET